MDIGHGYDKFFSEVKPALTSKLDEFLLLGYDTVTETELWVFLTKKKWKKIREDIRLHDIVQEILAVKVSDYMNFATIKSFKESEFSFDDQEEWEKLMKK